MTRSTRLRRVLLAFVLAVVATAVVLVGAARSRNASVAAIHTDATPLLVSAPQFAQAEIPAEFSCRGAGHSPAVSWSGAPAQTASFVVLMRDQDVPHPDFPIASFNHWMLYNIAPSITSLDANVSTAELQDRHVAAAVNSDRATGYFAPCPPIGRHTYVISVYALDVAHLEPKDNDAESLLELLKGHVLGYGSVSGALS